MSELLGVTVEQLVGLLKRRRAPLPFEIGTFVALETCEALMSGPASVKPGDVRIASDGAVAIFAPPNSASSEDAARSVISLLAFLLVAAGPGVPPTLLGLVERGPVGGSTLQRLRDDLEATLVPLNRSAARRVLSRMLREAQRETGARPAVALGAAISATAQVDAALDDLLGPGGGHAVLAAPAATRTLGADTGDFFDRPTAPRGVQSPPVGPAELASLAADEPEDTTTTQPMGGQTVDSVASLLDGLSTPSPPPARVVNSAPKPTSVPPPAALGPPAASKPLSVPPPAPPPAAAPLKAAPAMPPPQSAIETLPPPRQQVQASAPAQPARAPARPRGLDPDLVDGPVAATSKPAKPAVDAGDELRGSKRRAGSSGEMQRLPRPAPVTLSSMEGIDAPRKAGRGLAVFVILVLLAAGLAALVFYLRPDALARLRGERAPEEIEAERRAAANAAQHERDVRDHSRRFGELVVRATPDRAQVLLYVGRGPVEVKNLPSGVAHEFVALVDGRTPGRAVVPSDAEWETTPNGSRYELAMQVGEGEMLAEQLDLGETRLPRDVGTPGATLGTVRVVTAPRGAKVYQLIGFTPDVHVTDMRTDEAVELILFAPGHQVERVVVGPSDWREADGQRIADVERTLVELPGANAPRR